MEVKDIAEYEEKDSRLARSTIAELHKEVERLNTNWEVAQEDLSRIAKLLDLEEGCTIYDIEDRIDRLNNIINKIDKLFEADTNCEDIYYAIGVLLNKRFFDIKMVDNEEILNILGSDKE